MGASARRRVVVTGYGMVTPLAADAEGTFERAARGESGIDWITRFDARGLPCAIAGEVDDAWLDDAGARCERPSAASRGARFMLRASAEAARMAGLDAVADRSRVACVLGSHGDNATVAETVALHSCVGSDGSWDTEALLRLAGYDVMQFFRRKPDIAAGLVAARFRCQGPNLSLASACAAGAQAIGEAYRLIRDNRCEVALAGGCEATIDAPGVTGFILLRAVCERYTSPQGASRPFDRRRNGFVLSEGAGAVVLEDLEGATARGAVIHGEVLGYGDSADAYHITDVHPEGAGAILAMGAALADAGLPPEAVEYVNAHGTSTVKNDVTETRAIKAVLGERAAQVAVSSNKSMLGHTIAASGAIEGILTLMGMERSLMLPTINLEQPDPRCDLDYVADGARSHPHGVALSNSFGFGGHNACLCLGRWDG